MEEDDEAMGEDELVRADPEAEDEEDDEEEEEVTLVVAEIPEVTEVAKPTAGEPF